MSDERRIIGEVHVDPDAPGVIVRGDNVYVYPVDENGQPAQPPTDPAVLGDGWTDVGFTEEPSETDKAQAALRIERGVEPPPTYYLSPTALSAPVTLKADTIRTLLGMDPGALDEEPTPMVVRISGERAPMEPPRKRRGLTGKRYRIARRRYARTMKAWQRGLVPGISYVNQFTAEPMSFARVGQNAVSIGFRVSPQGAKPGYSGDHD